MEFFACVPRPRHGMRTCSSCEPLAMATWSAVWGRGPFTSGDPLPANSSPTSEVGVAFLIGGCDYY